MWIEKEFMADVIKAMLKIQFVYVENFVWVKFTPNNRPVRQPYDYINRTKCSCLIFKKEKDKVKKNFQYFV